MSNGNDKVPPTIPPTKLGPAADAEFSLSQAVLAPMDAVFKAQVHAARSFLSFLMQIGFPPDGAATDQKSPDGLPYYVDFEHQVSTGERMKVRVPTLALVPISPIGISSADLKFDFFVRTIARHRQLGLGATAADKEKNNLTDEQAKDARLHRDWFVVDEPLSLRGTFAPEGAPAKDAGNESSNVRQQESRLQIEIKMNSVGVPAALERLLTSLSQSTVSNPPNSGDK